MKKAIVATWATGLLIGGIAHANTVRHYTGTECDGIEPAYSNVLSRYNQGCLNTRAVGVCGSAGVVLPISGNSSDTVNYDDVRLGYFDGNTLEDVECQIGVRQSGGTIFTSAVLGSAGTGAGTLTWTGAALPNAGGNITGATVQHVYCYIPAEWADDIDSGCIDAGSRSEVRSYRVDAVNS